MCLLRNGPLRFHHGSHALLDKVAQSLQQLRLGKVGVSPDKGVDVNRLTVADFAGAPVMEEIGMVDAGWDNPGPAVLCAAKGQPCNPFFDGLQLASGPKALFETPLVTPVVTAQSIAR